MDDENQCKCDWCGKFFTRGTQGDNERYHLRCERIAEIADRDEDESDQYE